MSTSAQPEKKEIHVDQADFAGGIGTVVDTVPVHISYGIIERFSEGLYSSPNKAFEELVTNSYDAGAQNVWVYLNEDLKADGAVIAVIDDGESMDLEGLKSLWAIGRSRKRDDNAPKGRAQPVGKFGIGKLATYVLANTLTYITHQADKYFLVTMDYSVLSSNDSEVFNTVNLSLDAVELTRDQAIDVTKRALRSHGADLKGIEAVSRPDATHWTVAILGNLKPAAHEIKLWRVRWMLRTALPLNPGFRLSLNDTVLMSSKSAKEIIWTFQCGKDDKDLPGFKDGHQSTTISMPDGSESTAILLPKAGPIAGSAQLYHDSLRGGKSDEMGRSYGFFVRVRGRLIDSESESGSFGVDVELRHGTLSRFYMEIEAPELDVQVASTRESLKESEALDELRRYLLAVFNKARGVAFTDDQSNPFVRIGKDNRLADPPEALTQGPLRRMFRRAAEGETNIQDSLGFNAEIVGNLDDTLAESEKPIVEYVLLEEGKDANRLIGYDPKRRAAVLNSAHPFVRNYSTHGKLAEPLKLFGLAELVTEAYMLDEDISPVVVRRIIRRRDDFLRALVKRYPRSAVVVAQQLRDARNKKKELEDAVGDALELFGYHVQRLGGSNHGTDGIATIKLGRRDEPRSDSYAFTYDAKSSGKLEEIFFDEDGIRLAPTESAEIARIRADTARTSILRVHRELLAERGTLVIVPQSTLLVAPDFQGSEDQQSLIARACRNDNITPIRVADLADLVELFPIQGLNPISLRDLLALRTPAETAAWVAQQKDRVRTPRPRIDTLIKVIVRYSETKSSSTLERLSGQMNSEGWDEDMESLGGLVRGLKALAPDSFYFDGMVVALNATPQALFEEIRMTLESYTIQDVIGPYLSTIPNPGAVI